MKLAIMQPYFYPYLGYFQLIKAVDKFILYENVNFRKASWMTKNVILAKKANPFYIYVPVESRSSNKRISEIKIFAYKKWQEKLINLIHHNYYQSKYYHEIKQRLDKIIYTETDSLHTYNSKTICMIAELLGITTKIDSENTHYLEMENQLQLKYQKKQTGQSIQPMQRKTERVILIAKQENADVFINAIGGSLLYSKTEFAQNNIDLFFIKTNNYNYKQSSEAFFSGLSIIDVLMNCGIEGTIELLNHFELE